jgi:hypothetical protein
MATGEVSPGKQALAGMAGAVIGQRLADLPGAMAGAGAVPYISALIDEVQVEFRHDQQRRVSQMADAAGEASGRTSEALGQLMGSSEQNRLLTATAAEATAKTA